MIRLTTFQSERFLSLTPNESQRQPLISPNEFMNNLRNKQISDHKQGIENEYQRLQAKVSKACPWIKEFSILCTPDFVSVRAMDDIEYYQIKSCINGNVSLPIVRDSAYKS